MTEKIQPANPRLYSQDSLVKPGSTSGETRGAIAADLPDGGWSAGTGKALDRKRFTCGFCDTFGGSRDGWDYRVHTGGAPPAFIRVCESCHYPTLLTSTMQSPGPLFGRSVSSLPADVAALYREARRCHAASAPTAAIMVCRKILMHVAVEKKAEEDKTFSHYVNYLFENHHIPEDSKEWVEHMKKTGNEANHQIELKTIAEAELQLAFTEMLLRMVYDFPKRLPTSAPATPNDARTLTQKP